MDLARRSFMALSASAGGIAALSAPRLFAQEQAAEALKLIAGVGQSLAGRLLMLDGRAMEWNTMRVQRHADCPVCVAR